VTRRATKIKEIRSQKQHVLLLDAGNSIITTEEGYDPTLQAKQSIEAMNLMGYDAMALGLGDMKLGVAAMKEWMKGAKFPFLSANLKVDGKDELVGQPYVVRAIGGHRIAIVGLTEAGQANGVVASDPVAAAKQIVPAASKDADVVIVLTHSSVDVSRKICEISGIDLIVCGGDQTIPNGQMTTSGAFLVHADVPAPGHAGRNMGLVQLGFDSASKMTVQANEVIPIVETLPEDLDMLTWYQKITGPQ
jgi:2',3'-cyclic-nucleotide 2'-phosphodiesterase (5'-nucleotidase family)